ncbi:hypothetical protein JW865_01065 [Candidatus Bathyarchaeota archaeon]|nr:hypothetical protein [Candidatus Bathyarchaeota archaeon]
MKPRLMPTSIFMQLARNQATKTLKNDIFQYYPKQAERLLGIADGAGVDLSWIFFAQSMELLITISKFHIPTCTSIGFKKQLTEENETIIGKNFDYPKHFLPLQLTCNVKPKGAFQTLGCTMAPLAGMLDGMNEYGLTVTQNLAYTTDKPKYFAPNSLALQEMLETCRTTDEAVNFIIQAKRSGNYLLMIADSEDNIRTVEISNNYFSIREPIENKDINTNHYHTSEMQKHEIPHNAVFISDFPPGYHGKRIHESSEQRYNRAQELMSSKDKLNGNDVAAILRDHGKSNSPSNLTICQHDRYLSTLRSMIFYPKRKTIKILYGNPCQNEYQEFTFL